LTVHAKIRGEPANLPVADTGSSASPARRLTALTNDPLLIKALQDLAGGGIDVSVVPDLRNLSDELLQHGAGTALIDAEALDSPVEGVVDAIHQQLPDVRLMVAGHGTEQQQLASRIASQAVFRFVHKPASPQRLKLFLDAATRPSERTVTTVAAPAANAAPARIRTASGGKAPQALVIGGVVAVLAIAAAAWAFWPASKTADTAPAIPAPATNAPVQDQIAALIERAKAASAASRYVASDGSSSAEMYQEALRLQPSSRAAREGFDKAIEQGLHKAEEALLAGRLNDASAVAAAVALLAPGNSRLDFLNAQLSKEMARANMDASQRQANEARQVQIRAALDVMKDRLQRGTLIEPAAGSAVASFREAETIGVNDPAVRSAREALVAALLTAADAEITAHRNPAARKLLDSARSINSNAPGLDVLRRRVDEVVAQPAAPEPAAQPPRAEPPPVAAVTPPPTAAPEVAAAPPAAASPANEVISARNLKILRSENPVYPERALEKLVSGWVELEFTVMKNGTVKAITVTKAEPAKIFDEAATSALARYRFAPVTRDGSPVEQRASLRMRFTAQDAK
jgi:TonB family protein